MSYEFQGNTQLQNLVRDRCPDIKGVDRLILMELAWRSSQEGVSWPAADTLAYDANVSIRTVDNAVKALVEAGYLSVEHRTGRGNSCIYTLSIEAIEAARKPDRPSSYPRQSAETTQSVHSLPDETTQSVQSLSGESLQSVPQSLQSVQESLQSVPIKSANRAIKSAQYADEGLKETVKENLLRETLPPPIPINPRAREEIAQRQAVVRGAGGPWEWLHTGACSVLVRQALSMEQHERIAAFFDEYGQDIRLTSDLVSYATGICTDQDKRDLRYWLGILRKRMRDPTWVSVSQELADAAARKQKEGLENGGRTYNGQGNGSGGGLGADRGGGSHAPIWSAEVQRQSNSPGLMAAMERHIAANGKPKPGDVHSHEGFVR